MKHFFMVVILLFVVAFNTASGQNVVISNVNKTGGYVINATNKEIYPVSIIITFQFTNLSFSDEENKIFVLPANAVNHKLGEINVIKPGKAYNFSYKYKSTMGDATIKNIDANYQYDLPFKKGASFKLFQGYNGTFSHQNENALDFTMPEGTPILAAREGLVVEVVQANKISCSTQDCKKYNNYITILHPDGSFAQYAHIQFNGAIVKIGDTVKKSQQIALSGNVGYSSGPHLHFICFLAGFDKWNSQKTVFKVGDGTTVTTLKEGNNYPRNY